MFYKSVVLATLFATSLANPIAKPIAKRDEEIYDEDGNFEVEFSEKTIFIGDIELDTIFKDLRDNCHKRLCDTSELVYDGQTHDEVDSQNIQLTLSPHGAYGDKVRDDLLDAWEAVVKETAKCEDVTTEKPCPNPMVYCPNEPKTHTQCEVPAFWGVTYLEDGKKESDKPPSYMATDLDIEANEGTLCQDLLENMGTVAGVVHGVAGGLFTLLSLSCRQ